MRADPAPRRSDDVRRHYSELVDALRAGGDAEAARQAADLAVTQGVWRHALQRPTHYVPSLDPRPVYDPADFWFTGYLRENHERIRAELDAVTRPAEQGFLPVEEPLLGRGRWEQVTFYETGVRFDDACARFPVTAGVVDGIPEATAAGPGVVTLSWLYPGTHIVPHCGGSNARLRVHLGLRVPEGPRIRVGTELLTWEEGGCLVFDDSFEHEVWHDGDRPRVILLLDVCHPALDAATREWMLSGRASFADRMTAYMRERGIERVEIHGDGVTFSPNTGAVSLVRRHLQKMGASAVELHDGELRYEKIN
ncbi:aspartyl/asparaginyl beta-hydroxylase domain-containing protein [Streptosporangium sp. NPDC004631]